MAIENPNPFLKQQSYNYKLDFKGPQDRSALGLTSEQRTSDPLLLDTDKIRAEESSENEEENKLGLSKVFAAGNNANIANYNSDRIAPATPSVNFNAEETRSRSATPSGAGGKATSGAMEALNQAPGIAQTFSTKPTSEKEANGRLLSMTVAGASIGTAVAPGIGTAIGAVAGFGGGLIANSGWKGDLRKSGNEATRISLAEDEAERKQNFYLNKNSEQIKAEMDVFAQAQGIYNT